MNLKSALKTMSPEEIEDYLCGIVESAEKEADRLKALELLMKKKGIIQHGNITEKKDYREVIVGGGTEAGESSDDR